MKTLARRLAATVMAAGLVLGASAVATPAQATSGDTGWGTIVAPSSVQK
ncbi:hypothetical protein [Nocardioides jensenii]|nr:hypothetical protein [Nocardioides jensenii]